MLKAIGQDAKREGLGFCDCLIGRLTIGEHAWKFKHFREPATVAFLFVLNCESHRHLLRACYHEFEREGSKRYQCAHGRLFSVHSLAGYFSPSSFATSPSTV